MGHAIAVSKHVDWEQRKGSRFMLVKPIRYQHCTASSFRESIREPSQYTQILVKMSHEIVY